MLQTAVLQIDTSISQELNGYIHLLNQKEIDSISSQIKDKQFQEVGIIYIQKYLEALGVEEQEMKKIGMIEKQHNMVNHNTLMRVYKYFNTVYFSII